MEKITLYYVIFAYLLVLLVSLVLITSSRRRAKRDFFRSLTNKIQAGLISTKNDVTILVNSINRKYGITYSLLYYLEDYLTYISAFKPSFKKEDQDLLNEIILSEQADQPFSGVPEEEKCLLINIESFASANDTESIKNNLHELGSVLATKNRIYTHNEKINKWSIPIAIFSIIVTIIFGYLSLRGVDYEKIKVINSEAIQEVVAGQNADQ